MNRPVVTFVIVVALAVAGAAWFFNNFDRVLEKQWVGFQGEARRNAFLASERLLARMGVSVRHAKLPGELRELPGNGTLILPDRRSALAPDERRHLIEWVEGGGHLIVEDENYRLPDYILDALGVTRKPTPQPPPKPTPKAKAEERSPKPVETRFVEVRLPHAPAPMRVRMHSLQTLEAPHASLRVESKDATHLVHFPRGRGQVTVLNDLEFMRNGSIGQSDHAEFVWQLVRFQPDTAAVFVFDRPQRLSLARWLVDNAWAALAGGALLLALWLWRVAPRFGPLAPDPEPARRRLLDHLRASGRYLWSAGGAATLAESAREAALRRIGRAQPDFAGLAAAERGERLEASFGLAAGEAQRVLQRAQTLVPHEFVSTMRVFQRIHERLSRRGQGAEKR
jgi:hypothetical protein